jgi:prefoldin subunit 5
MTSNGRKMSTARATDGGERSPSVSHMGLDAELDRALPASDDAAAFLIVGDGRHRPGRVFGLSRNTVVLGRVDDADIHLVDPSVSGHHARIINGAQGYEIEDLDSTNGTYIGGRRIRRMRLQNGERVTVGNVEMTFVLEQKGNATIRLAMPGERDGWGSPTRTAIPYYPGPKRLGPMRDHDEEGPSLAEIVHRLVAAYRFLRSHARLIALLAIGGAALGLGSVLLAPPPATAACDVRLLPRVKSNPVETQWHPPDQETTQFFAGAERGFTNPDLVRATLLTVEGQDPDETHIQAVAARMKLEGVGDNRFRASYLSNRFGGAHPPAVPFLNAHLKTYVQSEIEKTLHGFSAEVDFLRDQMKTVERDMASVNETRARFRESNADRLPEEAAQTHISRFQLESKRAELVAQVRRLQGEVDNARRRFTAGEPLAQTKLTSSQSYRDSLAGINRKLTEAQARGFTDQHPDVIQYQDEKRRIEKLIETEMSAQTSAVDKQSNPGYQFLQAQIDGFQSQLRAARSDLADTESSLGRVRRAVGAMPRIEGRIEELNHSQEATMRLHGQLFEKLKKAELQLNLERVSAQARFEVVTAPRLERPRLLLTVLGRLFVGLALGLFIAAAVILWREGRRLISQTLARTDSVVAQP